MEITAIARRKKARRPDQSMPAKSSMATCACLMFSMASSARGSIMAMQAPRRLRRHRGEARGAPARPIVLVDDHRANALIEVLSIDDARHDAPLRAHAVRKRPLAAAPQLRQRELEAERRLGADGRGDGAGPFGIIAPNLGTTCRRLGVEPREYILDAVAGEDSIDGGAVHGEGPLPRRFRKGAEQRVDRRRAAQRVDEI